MALFPTLFQDETPIGAPTLGLVVNELGARWAMGVRAFDRLAVAFPAALRMRVRRNVRIRRYPSDDPWWRPCVRYDVDDIERRTLDLETPTHVIVNAEAEARKLGWSPRKNRTCASVLGGARPPRGQKITKVSLRRYRNVSGNIACVATLRDFSTTRGLPS